MRQSAFSLKSQVTRYLRERAHGRGRVRMGAEVLFHPDHVIPPAEFIAALIKPPDEAVAHVLVELDAVFRQKFVVLLGGIGDAGVGVFYPLRRELRFKPGVQEPSEPAPAEAVFHINRRFHRPVIGRALVKGPGIGVAEYGYFSSVCPMRRANSSTDGTSYSKVIAVLST